MKLTVFILFFFLFGTVFAQKILEREFNVFEISTIQINSNVISSLIITSKKTNTIKIKTQINGTDYENVILSIIEESNTLKIGAAYTPYFKLENDKLAVHKILSITMQIIVPETMKIQVKAAIASLITSGEFKEISVELEEGSCSLNNFKGNAMLKTKQGFILVYAYDGVNGTAISKNGIVVNTLSSPTINKEKNNTLKFLVEAESISGDISLLPIIK